MNKVNCSKCDGTGFLHGFSHIKQGVCFSCNGEGFKMLTDKQLKQYEEESKRMTKAIQKEYEQEEKEHQEELHKLELAEERKQANIEKYKNKLGYIGSIGEKVKLTLTLKFKNQMKYNNLLYVLEDKNKNNISFYSKEWYITLNDVFEIEATIKEHKEVNGYKQTILKNVTVLNHIDIDNLTDEEIDQLPI